MCSEYVKFWLLLWRFLFVSPTSSTFKSGMCYVNLEGSFFVTPLVTLAASSETVSGMSHILL